MENIMLNRISIISFFAVIALFSGCSSKPFKVVTEPEQAEIFIVDSEGQEKSVGLSPLMKKKKEMKMYFEENSPGELVNVLVKKDGYKSKNIFLPLNAGGNLGTQLNLTLSKGVSSEEELKTAEQLIEQVFKAQQYARADQLERALIEIDKALEKFPNFERAMTMKAAILYGQGQFKESLKWYENAIDENPELKSAVEMAGKIRKTLKLPVRIPASKSSKKSTGKVK
jgi:tetratricopeptide (TPR) repeat protein